MGGSERNVVKIATGLDPARFTVKVLGFIGDGPLRADLDSHGIPVVVVGWSFDTRRLWENLNRLQKQIEQVGPDIIHVFNHPTIYFALAAGVEASVPVRVVAIQAHDTWKRWTERIMDRLLRPTVTLYLADGDGARRFAIHHQGLDPARVRLLYDGPDLEGLIPSRPKAKLRESFGLRADRPVVGMVARLHDAHKGQSVFLRSVARLPADIPAQFVLVGGGDDEPMLRKLASDLGLANRVLFAGPQPQLGDVLHALDILVIPSLRYESVPKILLEGMAVGCPVVASRVGDIPEFLEDGVTGILVEPGDPTSLAAAILRLLTHPDQAQALGEQARTLLLGKRITLAQSLATLSDLYWFLATARAQTPGMHLRSQVRRAMKIYYLLRLGNFGFRWLMR